MNQLRVQQTSDGTVLLVARGTISTGLAREYIVLNIEECFWVINEIKRALPACIDYEVDKLNKECQNNVKKIDQLRQLQEGLSKDAH